MTLRRRSGYATHAAAIVLTAAAAIALLIQSSFLGHYPALASASSTESETFGAANAATGTSLSASPTAATTAGDTLVATIRARNTSTKVTVTLVTDSNGERWTKAVAVSSGSHADGEIWYFANAESIPATGRVTVTVSAASAIAVTVLDLSGASVTPLDQTATSSGRTTTASTGTTLPTSQASEIAVADIGWNGTATPSGPSAGYTTTSVERSTVSGTATGEQAAWQLLGTPGPQTYKAILSASVAWTGAIATFETSLVSTPPPTPTATPAPTATPTPTPTPAPTATPSPVPPGTAAADRFQRSVASGWGSADTGGWWTVVGSPWAWSVSPGAGSVTVAANAEERAYLSRFVIQDVDVLDEVVLPRCGENNCDAFVLGRYTPAYDPTYYRVGVVQGDGRADIFIRAQRSDGTSLGGDIDTGLRAADGVKVWQRVEFVGVNPTVIRSRVWLVGTLEPSTWLLNITDDNAAEQTAGMVGVRMRNEDTGASQTFGLESYQATGGADPISQTPNPTGVAHWLYVLDDGLVSVDDIDDSNKLVKQFPIPEAGKRGVVVAPSRGLLYVSECGPSDCSGKNGSLLAYDLANDVVAWIANYSFGVDQPAVTPDGSTIYMPHGADASDGTYSILDASDGEPIGSIYTGTNGHNTIASLDGTQVYLTGYTGSNFNDAHVVNPGTNAVMLNAGPTINGIRPFTINGEHTLMFTTSSNACGFQVLSLTTGNVLYTVPFAGSCTWTASSAPSHGISLSPDETRVYVMDAPLERLEVYDVSSLPTSAPSLIASVKLSSLTGTESPCQTYCEREGWVLNDLSGGYVYVGDTGDVVSTTTLQVVSIVPALENTRILVEIDWSSGTPSATSTRFGIGRVTS